MDTNVILVCLFFNIILIRHATAVSDTCWRLVGRVSVSDITYPYNLKCQCIIGFHGLSLFLVLCWMRMVLLHKYFIEMMRNNININVYSIKSVLFERVKFSWQTCLVISMVGFLSWSIYRSRGKGRLL